MEWCDSHHVYHGRCKTPGEQLEWPDGTVIILPDTTGKRASRWTEKFIAFVEANSDHPELVERFLQAILDEDRNAALLPVERALVKEIV
jgi:hypothetical protein